jgi:hypothetical protein
MCTRQVRKCLRWLHRFPSSGGIPTRCTYQCHTSQVYRENVFDTLQMTPQDLSLYVMEAFACDAQKSWST